MGLCEIEKKSPQTAIPSVSSHRKFLRSPGAGAAAAVCTMLRLLKCILTQQLSSPSASTVPPFFSLRLLSTAAPPVLADPGAGGFAVQDYLVATCGLSRARALKASTRLSHLNSPTKPDAVLAFLAGLGFSRADVAAAVARNPSLLCAKVEGTLSPIVAGLTGLGLSHSEIARLASLTDYCFRTKSVVAKLRYYHHLFGSSDKLLRVLKVSPLLLSCSIGTVVQPNVAFLRECGVDVRHIASLCVNVPRLLTTNPERVRAMAACAEGVGVPRGSGMFREALQAVAFLSEEEIAAKLDYLKNTFRWSDAEVRIALSGYPSLLRRSKDMLLRKSEFLISEVGLEPAYIARLPVMLCLSLEGRLRPRYDVIMFLMANGLLKRVPKYYPIFRATDKAFFEAYIYPHKEAAPHLAEYYATACRGEVPTGFTLTGTKNGL
ncbi:unnamed protein product [Triticum turgidum subsp. durum]|uniref:Uncharacterized protein n=1 Tax=Triticum turgidum subsp. durum TaxID=4567 RepID=A0A9R0XSH7_TRITD|nr:unnamed protein product [Triticum turgidum subsp. durum]